ncbi:glycosyl hydrolase family 5 [Caulobacter sp. Root487D2Y]|uniref:cellulase family glycosylhydrolase n=1 Tax=Caulobacter sp. Root487D2Y TaxID=1736547 RepID=UPI0006F98B77|nr:cellulase family glycosylhydrolase [Caulobacter sp. Root487D2Y]KQY29739.1 glycosyl hydrolase family 5 [Caulobacter sp. Root487D2Y]
MKALFAAAAASLALLSAAAPAQADGWLKAKDKRIVDETGRPVLLRGMGLGGWMLQEGYMLRLGELGRGQEHVIRAETAKLVGVEREAAIHQAWLDNHTTKADIDAMAAMGFNSVRLPMHYGLLTLAADQEPVAGQDTWKEDGFKRIDDLLAWTKANGMYLILDLHAAPGGQGADLPIADRDPSKPSLWQSPENRRKVVALWRKLAARYKDEPAIGAYDLLNEPNWDFDGPGGDYGCKDEKQTALWDYYKALTAAVREIDKRHMIILEGNCWGNNYKGLPAVWDDNLALSFHKYWNANDEASIATVLKLREETGLPLWLGESGENSNAWFRDAIALVERHEIGWAFWPLKKIGFNQPLEVTPNPGYAKLVDYWTRKGPQPTADEAYAALMTLASRDVRFENTLQHPDVVDAMIRQPHDDTTRPFKDHRIGAKGAAFAAVDYDLGALGQAYADKDTANYHVSTGGQRTLWNNGRTYRNDGVDIAREADASPYVEDFIAGEWLKYTVVVERAGTYALTASARAAGEGGKLSATVDGGASDGPVPVPTGAAWAEVQLGKTALLAGRNVMVLRSDGGPVLVKTVRLAPR